MEGLAWQVVHSNCSLNICYCSYDCDCKKYRDSTPIRVVIRLKWTIECERASRAAETRASLRRLLRMTEATSVNVAVGLPDCGWVGSLARAPMEQQGAWNSPRAHWLFRMARAWSERRVEAKVGIPSLISPPAWRAQG